MNWDQFEAEARARPEAAEKFFCEGSARRREHLDRRQIRKIVKRHHVRTKRFGYLTHEITHPA
jgi:hypothetical protein